MNVRVLCHIKTCYYLFLLFIVFGNRCIGETYSIKRKISTDLDTVYYKEQLSINSQLKFNLVFDI